MGNREDRYADSRKISQVAPARSTATVAVRTDVRMGVARKKRDREAAETVAGQSTSKVSRSEVRKGV